ncbi:hypothetical protein ACFRFH_14215 [Leifsonia sp. NPDC056824]|uniref:hypothetical protein n=1 Tax=Leifsonia sp. NPDC056824 TaxID=3345953 RepID=UPI0036888267
MKQLLAPALVVGLVAVGSVVAVAAPASAASTIAVGATYQLNTNQGPQQRPLDPASQTDVTSGEVLVSLSITNNDTETYTLDAVTPTSGANQCSGTIAPGATLDCFVSPTFASGAGVLDLTLTGSFPVAGPDTTVVSYPYFGVDYRPDTTDFALQAPPPATGWLTTIPDPQLLSYPGLFRPLVRLAVSWNGNTPVTITRATAELAPVSDQCFGALPKVVNPGDPILSCTFPIGATSHSWGFQYTGAMGEQQAYAGFVSYMAPFAPCQSDKPSYAGGETITVTCSGMAAGVSARMRIWDVGVSDPQTIAADGTVTFTFALPTITSTFASGSLLFRTDGDPATESAGATAFTITPGVAAGTGSSGGSGSSRGAGGSATTVTAELADSGSDVTGPALGGLLAIVLGGLLLAVRRRRAA